MSPRRRPGARRLLTASQQFDAFADGTRFRGTVLRRNRSVETKPERTASLLLDSPDGVQTIIYPRDAAESPRPGDQQLQQIGN
jgi:hypothetical protein